jgi:hypothetical protein
LSSSSFARPQSMIECARRASVSSLVRSVPPSPLVRIFDDWWLNEPKSPMHPAPWSFQRWPCAWAQSSITARSWRRAMSMMRSMSAI